MTSNAIPEGEAFWVCSLNEQSQKHFTAAAMYEQKRESAYDEQRDPGRRSLLGLFIE